MDYVTGMRILTSRKGESYDSILVIVDRLTKMVHYEPVKITIDATGLAEVIINVVIRHHSFLNSVMSDGGSVFILKFW